MTKFRQIDGPAAQKSCTLLADPLPDVSSTHGRAQESPTDIGVRVVIDVIGSSRMRLRLSLRQHPGFLASTRSHFTWPLFPLNSVGPFMEWISSHWKGQTT